MPPPRQAEQPGVDRQADEEVQPGEDEVDRAPVEEAVQPGGDRPEDRRSEAGDQGQMGYAALRAERPDLHDGDESRGVEHEAGGKLHRHQRGDKAEAFRRQGAGGECQRGGGRADGHHPSGTETVGHAPGRRREQAAEEERQRQGRKNPLLRQVEIACHGRREDGEAVEKRSVADDLGDAERPDRERRRTDVRRMHGGLRLRRCGPFRLSRLISCGGSAAGRCFGRLDHHG